MRIKYCLTSKNNPLYGGEFFDNERYKTFGQHSFILDFIATAKRNNCSIDLLIEGKENFPLYEYMLKLCNIIEFRSGVDHLNEADVVIIDKLSEEAIDMINTDALVFCFIHNAGEQVYKRLIDISQKIVCMSETAMKFQSNHINKEKLVLCHQGVDMTRFFVREQIPAKNHKYGEIKILLFTRLMQQKRSTIIAILNELLKQKEYSITILGDGDFFWEISNSYGNTITVINHIPCNSIQTFLPEFDVVISSARGVMEACACGIPAICAGFGYAGIISDEKIPYLMIRNLTGYGELEDISAIHSEIGKALLINKIYWRNLCKKYFDMDIFFQKIINEIDNSQSKRNIPINSLDSCHD